MKTVNPVVWFEIYVNDLQKAQKFYESVLKVKLTILPTPTNEPMQMLTFPSDMDGGGATGALVKMEGFKAGGNSTLVYFTSKDCSIEESRVKPAGGKVLKSKFSLGQYGFCTLAIDTEGNMFGIHSMQ